jgi:peptidoglycan hydrolase CwlO-like protein
MDIIVNNHYHGSEEMSKQLSLILKKQNQMSEQLDALQVQIDALNEKADKLQAAIDADQAADAEVVAALKD